jgi:hypothetical protein
MFERLFEFFRTKFGLDRLFEAVPAAAGFAGKSTESSGNAGQAFGAEHQQAHKGKKQNFRESYVKHDASTLH